MSDGDSKYKPKQVWYKGIPPKTAHTFNVEAFDESVASQGVLFEHWRAMRCPVGLIDKFDTTRRPHDDHEGCTNGFIYTKVGCVQATLTSNTLDMPLQEMGILASSLAKATFPRFYADKPTERVYITPYDRLYIVDDNQNVLVNTWQVAQHSPSSSTGDKLSFPAVSVFEPVMDSAGNKYFNGDFRIINGRILWGATNPGIDPETGQGRIYSLAYLYRPHYYVRQMLHEIRVTQVDGPDGRAVEKMMQEALLQREYVFLNEDHRSDSEPESPRQIMSPDDSIFGPR
jgi:hypothetical protein